MITNQASTRWIRSKKVNDIKDWNISFEERKDSLKYRQTSLILSEWLNNDWVNDNHSFDDLFNEFFLLCVLLDFKCIILVQKQHCMMYRSNTLLVNSIFFFLIMSK